MSYHAPSYGFEPGLEAAMREVRAVAEVGAPSIVLIARAHGVSVEDLRAAFEVWASGPEGAAVLAAAAISGGVEAELMGIIEPAPVGSLIAPVLAEVSRRRHLALSAGPRRWCPTCGAVKPVFLQHGEGLSIGQCSGCGEPRPFDQTTTPGATAG